MKNNYRDKKFNKNKQQPQGQERKRFSGKDKTFGAASKEFIKNRNEDVEINNRSKDIYENEEKITPREDIIEGRNAVIEALKSDRTVEQILTAKGDREGSINVIFALAKEKGIVVKEVDRKKLDGISETGAHQGVIAKVTPYKYFTVEDILNKASDAGEKPFIVILDEIEDPHNLGSIIRTAELCGVHGIIIPKRRNAGITPTVYKSSAGAIEHMMVAKVTNINSVIQDLKEKNIWVYGADMEGEDYSYNADLSGAVALVIGSEGKGMSKLTKEKCDKLIRIPMVGKINSLNASVAGGILMYEVLKTRI
ncbi:23S rRNA (guanosine(2251)-2'-O)-methyltransferase RlmB [Clostridium polynesiense]|uniref:23S rRNA (guanosine(2251)-2'-O)-methyltransferase RlmB n=1 Tax=Clostridium polynesiense TaxID=1325933 RepID=UPI00058E2AA9|nr:23S rRNA (guanosine(2251)-2'-O)-methyltransferase RlmB [Clostridium polynesiense]